MTSWFRSAEHEQKLKFNKVLDDLKNYKIKLVNIEQILENTRYNKKVFKNVLDDIKTAYWSSKYEDVLDELTDTTYMVAKNGVRPLFYLFLIPESRSNSGVYQTLFNVFVTFYIVSSIFIE